ncbi:type II toxin-antitoxin system HipA family toxin [Actinomyces howellii]|uniref:Serine/threonine-protein kinase HipA n=1 Tax=Actinomyces howellii TaxID=52771 RepID=A0A3S4TAF0_9ACTO|nr:HipA domain-containing protein [Actinomyces howellii]VEG28877.1 Serine/threonine-protein kinase HipA [Actinomyces howellii]
MNEVVYAVLLHGEHVGSLQHRGRFTKLVFDADYWDRPHRMVLGRWFEDHPREQPHATNRVPAWFSNLLPEGRLRALIAREQEVSEHREMELLERIGRDLPGAVSVVPDPDQRVEAGFDDALASPERDPASARGPRRASLAGMALKFSMSRQGDRLVVPAHDEDGDWILKTPDQSYPGLPANELAVMSLARRVGIDVPEASLWDRDSVDDLGPGAWPSRETDAYAVRRFDRSPAGRVHIEDFAQVLGRVGAEDGKYRSNVETVLGLAYRGQDHDSLQEAVRRTVFNLLVGNGDAHLKNWSLIYPDGRRARLSPAYDLVCTAAYPELPELLGLPFLGSQRLDEVGREHFERVEHHLGVGREDVRDVLDETVESFRSVWEDHDAPDRVRRWVDAHLESTTARLTRPAAAP